MVNKNAEDAEKEWYWRNADGAKKGPLDLSSVRNLVLSGDISAQTQVSSTGADWISAVSCSDFGFDCIVLEVGEALNVLGPFAKEYIDRHDVMSGVPSDGILFVRGGTVGEALHGGVSGTTGAVLVEKVMAAEKELKASVKAKRAAEASLAAKDLEFDSERQKLNGIISGMKAAALKLQSELDGVRAELEGLDVDKKRRADLEAKLVDAENAAVKAVAEAERRRREAEMAGKKIAELESSFAATKTQSAGLEKQYAELKSHDAELETRLAEAGRKLTDRDGRCVELEGRLTEAKASVAEFQDKAANAESRMAELRSKAENADANDANYRESAEWLRKKLADLAGEVAERFYASEYPSPRGASSLKAASEDRSDSNPSFEAIEPEIVVQHGESSSYGVKLRQTKKVDPVQPQIAKLSAIENQLKREISSLGASAGTPGATGHDGFIGVFKRRKP